MITPEEIRDKAQRLYPKFVKAWLLGDDFFPRRVPADLTLPKDLAVARSAVEQLRNHAQQTCGSGYTITWRPRKSRSHGLNEFPDAICFESAAGLLYTTRREEEFQELKSAVTKIRHGQPLLEAWLQESTHWKDLLKVASYLDDLLQVLQYLLEHPRPDCFAREIPLPVSTKLIEENQKLLANWLDRLLPQHQIDFRFNRHEFEPRYGLRHVRHHLLIRCLDVKLQSRLRLKFDELSLPASSINQLPARGVTVFIVENKVNLLTLPAVNNAIAIGGLGKAISLLRDIHWLHDAAIFYWGDLDVEGFEMLSQCREMFAHTQSILMDIKTLQQHNDLAIPWPNYPGAEPAALTASEAKAYTHLRTNRIRLEQERIPQSVVVQCLHRIASTPQ